MEVARSTPTQQVALGSLLAVIATGFITTSVVLAQLPDGPPLIAGTQSASVVILGVLFLPLVWRHHKAGYAGAIAVGIFALVASLLGLIDTLTGVQAPEGYIAIITAGAVSVVLIVSSAAAWRQQA